MTPTEALSLAREALELASTIADRVPTRWHERDPSEAPAEHDIGCMVNAQPDGQHGYRLIHDALSAVRAALAQQASVPSAEPAGLVRCEFDDECDYCSSPQGGTFTRLMRNAEDVTEAEFYICNDCVFRALDGLKYGTPLMANGLTEAQALAGFEADSNESFADFLAGIRFAEQTHTAPLMFNGLTKAETRATASVAGLTPQETAATASVAGLGDWMTPTTLQQRMSDAVALLCGGKRPPDDLVAGWLDRDADDHRLQEFAADNGPAWAQGIGLLDAARVMADQPTEGVAHGRAAPQAAPVAPDGRLHADGYFTWAHRAGYTLDKRLPCDFWLAPPAASAPTVQPLTEEAMKWRKAVQEAYGWLWHTNNEPMAPAPMWSPEQAAYQARKCLRELLTSAERGEAINAIAAHMDKMSGITAAPTKETP